VFNSAAAELHCSARAETGARAKGISLLPGDSAPARDTALDGLRAVAIALVLVDHGFNVTFTTSYFFAPWSPGPAGVRLFFVLSGFLITGILLKARDQSDHTLGIWRAFYARRTLRIVPLAYAAILVAWIARVATARESLGWYLGYSSNILVASRDHFAAGLGHLWSLAVEEQFYLFWPAVVLWVPRHRLRAVMVGIAIGATVIRWVLVSKVDIIAAYVLTPARLDALAWGGVMAVSVHAGQQTPRRLLAGLGLALCVISWWWSPAGQALVTEPAMIALSAALIASASAIPRLSRLLSLRPLVLLGTISYGVYVWHALMPDVGRWIGGLLGVSLPIPDQPGVTYFAFLTTTASLVAFVSWRVFEKPLNDLKRYFPYDRRAMASTE
jgi:peptidoglycan/LPS O-acetylase OafA/YrhL